MLELGNSTPPADDLIQDVSEANFMEAVVDASQTTPIIVDFWAPWCGRIDVDNRALRLRQQGVKLSAELHCTR